MRRVILIALVGALLIAGCASNPTNGNQSMNNSTNGNSSMANTSAPNASSTSSANSAPKTNFTFKTISSKQVKVVDMGGDRISDNATKKLVVTVNNKSEAVWLSDAKSDNATGTYPLSIGNQITVNATAGDTVAVVWYPQSGQKQTLASQKVNAPETTTSSNSSSNASTTAMNGSTNGTMTNTTTKTSTSS